MSCHCPVLGSDTDHHVSVLLLQNLDSERGLFSFGVGFQAKSVRNLHILASPVLQVIAHLSLLRLASHLHCLSAMGTEVPESVFL